MAMMLRPKIHAVHDKVIFSTILTRSSTSWSLFDPTKSFHNFSHHLSEFNNSVLAEFSTNEINRHGQVKDWPKPIANKSHLNQAAYDVLHTWPTLWQLSNPFAAVTQSHTSMAASAQSTWLWRIVRTLAGNICKWCS
jgi:hypothetical protein